MQRLIKYTTNNMNASLCDGKR